jgi:hypothetical protein
LAVIPSTICDEIVQFVVSEIAGRCSQALLFEPPNPKFAVSDFSFSAQKIRLSILVFIDQPSQTVKNHSVIEHFCDRPFLPIAQFLQQSSRICEEFGAAQLENLMK